MQDNKIRTYLKDVVANMPTDWLELTTHRLDIYEENLAKTQFLEHFETLFNTDDARLSSLSALPTAFDYIRLGHPLSCVLEWAVAHLHHQKADNVIVFSSMTIPVMAVLRKNLLIGKNTRIIHKGELPDFFDAEILRYVYGYSFEVKKIAEFEEVSDFDGSTIFIAQQEDICNFEYKPSIATGIDFFINTNARSGSILMVNGEQNESYISEIQHVRRRETIAMTPPDTLFALNHLLGMPSDDTPISNVETNRANVLTAIKEITGTDVTPLVGSSGLSVQYAIMMGLVQDAVEKHPEKAIKIIIPPNCYGGTNDQARRVAACDDRIEVVDLPVDGGQDMVQSIDTLLDKMASEDAIPYIIVEIPTNPRVEVPDLVKLKQALNKERKTKSGEPAIDPVFILDQTFCPNVHFLGEGEILSTTRAIAYVSGSKFPSGGQCTAGYCVANKKSEALMEKIALHLKLCDNGATHHQMETLKKQLPSMLQRIHDAYKNTREFVSFIEDTLPAAKINFVSEALAKDGFTPSVFSLDLPTKGSTEEEKESYKRALNLKLIHLMITKIPHESKFCVSYGQLKGCYWTIPATSTQGTTKEGDKDYIVRVALSPDMNLDLHKKVFLDFVGTLG